MCVCVIVSNDLSHLYKNVCVCVCVIKKEVCFLLAFRRFRLGIYLYGSLQVSFSKEKKRRRKDVFHFHFSLSNIKFRRLFVRMLVWCLNPLELCAMMSGCLSVVKRFLLAYYARQWQYKTRGFILNK